MILFGYIIKSSASLCVFNSMRIYRISFTEFPRTTFDKAAQPLKAPINFRHRVRKHYAFQFSAVREFTSSCDTDT